MMTISRLPLLLIAALLAACAEPPLLVAPPGPALAAGEVTGYYPDRPRCDFVTVAHIRVDGGYYSLDSMFRKMRQQAAEVGADGLYVLHTQQMAIKEYQGTAKAIRCLSAYARRV